MKKNGKIILAIILILLLAALAFFASNYFSNYDLLSKYKKTIEVTVLEESLNDIGELATAEYKYTDAKPISNDAMTVLGHAINSTQAGAVYEYSGKIIASLNLSDIKFDVNNETKTVTVTLPQPTILSHEVDPFSYKKIYEDKSVINPLTTDNFIAHEQENKITMEKRAVEYGLFERATLNAQLSIKDMIQTLYPGATVVFTGITVEEPTINQADQNSTSETTTVAPVTEAVTVAQ